jgi:hypothetical protein
MSLGVGGVLRGHLGSARKECAFNIRYGDDAFSLILGVVLTSLRNLVSVLDFVELWIKFHVTFIHSFLASY